jgi:outer membrane protein OmpA-like peptidoglycan-associated protein
MLNRKKGVFFAYFLCLGFPLLAQNQEDVLWRVNTIHQETHPLVSPDGQRLYFVRENHELNIGDANKSDIWVATKMQDGSWTEASNLGYPVNNEHDNIIMGISLDGATIYFHNGKNIFSAQKKGRVWQEPKPLNITFDTQKALNGCISIDEKIAILSLDNEQSKGQNDLFVSIKSEQNTWSVPINLGEAINTQSSNESNAFLAADNKMLYFCSDKKGGLGGLDWYVTQRLDETWQHWSAPKNLGTNLNTEHDDPSFSLTFDGKDAFRTVKKENIQSDIEFLKIDLQSSKENIILAKGSVIKNGSNIPYSTPLKWQGLHQKKVGNTFNSDAVGNFQVLLSGDQSFAFFAQDKSYFSSLEYLNWDKKNLKLLDNEGFENLKSKKDSLVQFQTETLLIRVHDLNTEITNLQETGFVPEKKQESNLKKEEKTDFKVDPELEKLKTIFEKKEIIRSNNNTENNTLNNASEDELLHNTEHESTSAIRLIFEQYQKIKNESIDPKPSQNSSNTTENQQIDRAAMDDIAAIDGAKEKRQFADFQELSQKIKQDIAEEILPEIKFSLSKDLVTNWSNWKILQVSNTEEKMLGKVILDKKRTLIKQLEQQRKNSIERKKDNRQKDYDDIERNLYATLLPEVQTELLASQKSVIAQEIDWNMNFLLKTALRSLLQETLQSLVKKQISSENTSTSKPNNNLTSTAFSLDDPKKNVKISLFPIKIGEILPLNGLFFKENTADLMEESDVELLRLKKLLNENPTMVIEIRAHTHGGLTYESAQRLTQARATSIREALVKKGISTDRISANGYGKVFPIKPNNSFENRFLNQRIEFKVLR